MTEQKFKSEMRRARTMQSTSDDPMRSEYWAGYQRGLRRAYHGEKFGTEAEHETWLSAANSHDESHKQRGRGYNDGLSFGDFSSQIGRPPIGTETLPGITVPETLLIAIKSRAAALGLSLPDARREAYLIFSK